MAPTNSLAAVCIQHSVDLNGTEYWLYMGYLSASEIFKIAKVPSFSESKKNVQIAQGIPPHTDPVEDWQRPVINEKIKTIAEIYSSNSENNLMPNPVIISENPLLRNDSDVGISISPFYAQIGQQKKQVEELSTVKFQYTSNKQPLWLLDGQHRTQGMKNTANHVAAGGIDRSDVKIPFILLHGDSYDPSQLAKIFTHVTSGATAMDPIHKDWMHYSFKLPKYDKIENRSAMKAVTHLCIDSKYGNATDGEITNPFYDSIRFNPKLEPNGFYAFEFDAPNWSTLISKIYYKGNSSPLDPKDLAEQIAYAVNAFYELDSNNKNAAGGSVLFDNGGKRLTRLAEAYLCAVLHYLRNTSITGMTYNEWKMYLSDSIRDFGSNNWTMPWVGGLDGAPGNKSRQLAERVFEKYLSATSPIGHKIVDYLKGSGASFRLVSLKWNDSKNKKIENNSFPKKVSGDMSVGAASLSYALGTSSDDRLGLRIELPDGQENIDIVDVFDIEVVPSNKLSATKQKRAMNVEHLFIREPPGKEGEFRIMVRTRAFSSSTVVDTEIRIDRA